MPVLLYLLEDARGCLHSRLLKTDKEGHPLYQCDARYGKICVRMEEKPCKIQEPFPVKYDN